MSEAIIDDDWEDYEITPLDFHTSEQLRILEERRLIEEADNLLTDELFISDSKRIEKTSLNLTNNFIQKEKINNDKIKKISAQINSKVISKNNKQKENEEKQRLLSNILKKQKEDKKRLVDIYGEAQEKNDKYSYYEDQFYD
jgi:hypothetical protein